MALRARAPGTPCVVSTAVSYGGFPSIGRHHAPAIRFERAVHDLYGYRPTGAPDRRPWIDHGAWELRAPLGVKEPAPLSDPADYDFLPVRGEGLHQIPVGPVHAGIIEPGHFRFTANGETVARLEERLGYVHKGIDGLLTDVAHRAGRRASSPACPATPRWPPALPSPAPSRRRSTSPCRRARSDAARRDGGARAHRQPFRRHRRRLQRRRIRADPRPLRHLPRARARGLRRRLRASPDDGRDRAWRRAGEYHGRAARADHRGARRDRAAVRRDRAPL